MQRCAACAHDNRDGARFCEECGARLAAAPASSQKRKVVTVLFCDVTGSTALGERLDPEPLRALLARYFDRMRAIVERHGGTVEKFIGDAVMAVFGVPAVHEDDALRAARAALEMRDALPELDVEARIGVATGEVVVGTEERLATGDVVNVAARLQQAASPGEVLLADSTRRLLRDVVHVEAIGPLVLRGKAEAVAAHRLHAVTGEPARRLTGRLVGRARQLRLLEDAFASARDDRSCHLVTMLGAAGVGKSRLAAEFLSSLDASVVRGRCLSYGDGITYWPAVDVLKQLGLRPDDERATAAVAALLRESDEPATATDIAWAVRKTLEQAAADRPLAVVWDDLHWGEEAFLDLVDHVADWSRDAPILLLCMSRPELLDRRPTWAGGKLNATTILLEPLADAELEQLLDDLGARDERVRARVREAAGGNPLFAEEMLALVEESGSADVAVPPTIQALLAARLDQLEPPERALLERGAVEGQVFHVGAVQALGPDELRVPERLLGLVRTELVRPDRPQLAGEDAFRFRHLLVRDAAYDALPKAERAELHLRFARWLERRGADLVELDEILGYHLEHACRYARELGLPEDAAAAEAARRRLTTAAERAVLREDYRGAAAFAERALVLLPAGTADLRLELLRLDAAGFAEGLDTVGALAPAAVDRARSAGDRAAELAIGIHAANWGMGLEPKGAAERLERLVTSALPELEALGDDRALQVAYFARGGAMSWRGRGAEQIANWDRSLEHARRLPGGFDAAILLPWLTEPRVFGPTPAAELLAWLDEHGSDRQHAFRVARALGVAMLGRAGEALEMLAAERALLRDQGNLTRLAVSAQLMSVAAMVAGATELAEDLLAEACAFLDAQAEQGLLSTALARRATLLVELGRVDEAEAGAARALEIGALEDVLTQVIARRARARALAYRGNLDAAERIAREAVEVILATDFVEDQAAAYADLGDVLERAAKPAEAVAALESAASLYRAKGDVVSEGRVRARLDPLAALRPGPTPRASR